MLIYRQSPFIAFFVKAVTVLAVVLGPLSSLQLWLKERDYVRHGVTTTVSEPVTLLASASSTSTHERAGFFTGDISFVAADDQRYTVTRTLSEEEKWHAKEPGDKLRLEYLPADPVGSMRIAGHHLNPSAPLALAAIVIAFGLALWRVV